MARSVEYQGTHVHLDFHSDAAPEMTATLSEQVFDAEPFHPGDAVGLSWAESDVHRLSAAA